MFAYFFLALQSGGLPWLAKHTPFDLQQCGTFCVLQQDCTEKEIYDYRSCPCNFSIYLFSFFLMTHILCIFLVTTDTFEQLDFQPHVVYLFV